MVEFLREQVGLKDDEIVSLKKANRETLDRNYELTR